MDLCLPFPTRSFQIIAKQILNFPFLWYNDNPFRKRVGDGEFPLLVTQGTSQFSTYGLAVVVKKEFLPLEASLHYASRGRNSFSTTPAKPCVGNWDVPFVTRRGIHFLPRVAKPLVVGNIPSLTLFLKGLGHFKTTSRHFWSSYINSFHKEIQTVILRFLYFCILIVRKLWLKT